MIKEKTRSKQKEIVMYNLLNKYKWQMDFPPHKLR